MLAGKELARSARARPAESRSDLQYIFQNPYSALNPRRTIAEIVDQPLRALRDMPRAKRSTAISDVLGAVGLDRALFHRYPAELSGGQRQRVAIARALVCQPKLLICDEITSALDVSVQASIVQLLARLGEERDLGILFITHNLPLVRSIADEVLVLQHGRIVEQAPTEDLFTSPRQEYTRDLLYNTPSLHGVYQGALR
jgi:peptide/nickel transport system ATP-binding protein